MKAVVLAGGMGARLGPYTAHFPKPLMPLDSAMPVLELLLRQLRAAGVADVTLAVNHFHQLIRAYFGDGDRFGVRLDYRLEATPLGTAGPLAPMLADLGERFLVMNGDLLTTLDFRALVAEHDRTGADATIAAVRRDIPLEFGVLRLTPEGALSAYDEKPTLSHTVSMGCYLLETASASPFLRQGEKMDMPDLLRAMAAAHLNVRAHVSDAFWLDIGRPEDYAAAQAEYARAPERFLGGPA